MPDPNRRARGRAVVNIRAMVRTQPVERAFRRLMRQAPQHAQRSMATAVAAWEADTVRVLPVRASRPQRRTRNTTVSGDTPRFKDVGRGQLRQRTKGFVRRGGPGRIIGGIASLVHYAIWLAAGTRYIAGGRVMHWREGDPTITSWPAKRAGGNPRAELPIILPQRPEALRIFIREMRRAIRRDWQRGTG